jgi:hypothetical protein
MLHSNNQKIQVDCASILAKLCKFSIFHADHIIPIVSCNKLKSIDSTALNRLLELLASKNRTIARNAATVLTKLALLELPKIRMKEAQGIPQLLSLMKIPENEDMLPDYCVLLLHLCTLEAIALDIASQHLAFLLELLKKEACSHLVAAIIGVMLHSSKTFITTLIIICRRKPKSD